MTDSHIISYFQIRGWGKVSQTDTVGSLISQTAAGLADDEMRLGVGNITLFEDWVGATVWIVSGDQARIKTGYYTLIDVNSGAGRITIKGEGIASGYSTTGPFTGWGVRIEDFIKISYGGIPDFVSGSKARANWANLIIDVTNTISQKIEPIGGVATIDGFTITCLYKTGNELIEKLLVRAPTPLLDTNLKLLYLTNDDTSLANTTLSISDEPKPEYITTDPLYNGWVNTLNGEGIAINSWNSVNDEVTVSRGLLKTVPVWQSWATLFSEQIGQSQGNILEYYQIQSYARCYNPDPDVSGIAGDIGGAESLYFGFIDNINMDTGLSQFDIEVTSILLKPRLTTISYGLTEIRQDSLSSYEVINGAPNVDLLREINNLTAKPATQITINQRFKTRNWSWVKMGPVAMRIGVNQLGNITNLPAGKNPVIPAWRVSYPIADLMSYSNLGSPAYTPYYYNNSTGFVILDVMDSAKYNRTCLPPITDEAANNNLYWIFNTRLTEYDRIDERNEQISVYNFASSDIAGITEIIDSTRTGDLSDMAPSLVHVFEQGGGQLYGINRAILKGASDNWPTPDGYVPPITANDLGNSGRSRFSYIPVIDVRDLILQILTSMAGKQGNPVNFVFYNISSSIEVTVQQSFDVLPEGIGLGVPGDLIDTSGFLFMRDPTDPVTRLPGGIDEGIPIANVSIDLKNSDDVLDWMKKNILQPLSLALVQTKEGKLSVIKVSDTRGVLDWTPITTNQLQIDSGRITPEVSQIFDSSRIFSVLSYDFKQPMFMNFTSTAINVTRRDFVSDGYAPALVFGGSYQQIGKKVRFSNLPVYLSDDLIGSAQQSLGLYSNATSEISIRMRDDDLYETISINLGTNFFKKRVTRDIGIITQINIPNLITDDGVRGGQNTVQLGFIKSIQREFKTNTSIVTILLLPSTNLIADYFKTWTASGVIDTATSTILSLTPQYTLGGDDTQGFSAADKIQLFNAAFEPISDPQTIDSISTNQITLVASFNGYGGGGPITATSGNIIKHAPIDLQIVTRKSFLANFSDTTGDDLDKTVFST